MEDRPLSTDEKREYLRLFFMEGRQAAGMYYRQLIHLSRMVFESREEADEYFRQQEEETGESRPVWVIVMPPIDDKAKETKG